MGILIGSTYLEVGSRRLSGLKLECPAEDSGPEQTSKLDAI
jgi:hypothetical protein